MRLINIGMTMVVIGAVLAGCTTVTETAPEAPPVSPEGTDIHISVPELPLSSDQTKIITPGAQTSPAVVKLLEQARNATLAGDLQRAEVILERAIRIEPKNPLLWHYLAKVRLQQGRFNEAAGLAQKSNALTKADKPLQADNWRIIAHARNRSGDMVGAREAQGKVDALLAN